MSAIDYVSSDVLAEIFLYCLPMPCTSAFDDDPQQISQVCRRWRTITFALPALWASFRVTCSPDYLDPLLHIIRTFLLRSGTHPLDFALDTAGPVGNNVHGPNPQFPAILAALAAARKTWRCIFIMIIPEVMQETLDMIAQGDAPILETLRCTIYEGASWMPPIRLRAPRGCPRLESLTWKTWGGDGQLLRPPLEDPAWGQLTTIRIDAILTVSDCLSLIQYSPRLSNVEFSYINSLGDHVPPNPLRHATLRSLYTRGTHSTTLLNNTTLPALAELEFRYAEPREDSLHAFLLRSTPPLSHFSITDLHLSESTLLRALALMGELRSLTIREFNGRREPPTATLIQALHPPPLGTPGALCPRLFALQIFTLDCPDGVLGAMLRARCGADAQANGVTSLRYVHVEVLGGPHGRDIDMMQTLKVDGLNGTLLYLGGPGGLGYLNPGSA